MTTEIRVPSLGESVTEATVAQWFKGEGDTVSVDEPICELETDKVTVEVPAPSAGILSEILAPNGQEVEVGALLGKISEAEQEGAPSPGSGKGKETAAGKAEKPEAAEETPQAVGRTAAERKEEEDKAAEDVPPVSPAARKIMHEEGLTAGEVIGTGKDGRVLKSDVLETLERRGSSGEPREEARSEDARGEGPAQIKVPVREQERMEEARETRVRMTRLRKTIAQRLKDAQNTAAMLTTFNEVDMTEVVTLRNQYKEIFEKKHGVRLGFMSFFVKACIAALQDVPTVNAEIDGDEIVYKNYYNIGVAVGTDRGLVVPVIRGAEALSMAGIEKTINDLAQRARSGNLELAELQGGTFSITNGGIYGSLMSTPILNAPQSGILGMHKIQERPMIVDGKVEARPMMYLALSYDHRIVDGREAVTFLVRVKECIEDPERLLLDL